MKGSLIVSSLFVFVFLFLLTLSDASSADLEAEAPVWTHKCMKSFNISVCNKLECVKICVDRGIGWQNGECLDEHQCCCNFQ